MLATPTTAIWKGLLRSHRRARTIPQIAQPRQAAAVTKKYGRNAVIKLPAAVMPPAASKAPKGRQQLLAAIMPANAATLLPATVLNSPTFFYSNYRVSCFLILSTASSKFSCELA